MDYDLRPIGHVESPLTDRESAPRQPDEGAPPAWLVLDSAIVPGLGGLAPGDEVILLTWLDRARPRRPPCPPPRRPVPPRGGGVFNIRSPDRPNPIGLHRVQVTGIDGNRVQVAHLEALEGTPILDIKPILPADPTDR
jgi:tRNA-Thr(GGU) m(6)t(6)A37 methyltransferase TsaA